MAPPKFRAPGVGRQVHRDDRAISSTRTVDDAAECHRGCCARIDGDVRVEQNVIGECDRAIVGRDVAAKADRAGHGKSHKRRARSDRGAEQGAVRGRDRQQVGAVNRAEKLHAPRPHSRSYSRSKLTALVKLDSPGSVEVGARGCRAGDEYVGCRDRRVDGYSGAGQRKRAAPVDRGIDEYAIRGRQRQGVGRSPCDRRRNGDVSSIRAGAAGRPGRNLDIGARRARFQVWLC